MKQIIFYTLLLTSIAAYCQPNCEAYKYYGDELKYKACMASQKRAGHYQFSREYQEALDDALAIDSTYSHAFQEKSTAYLKSGDFVTWKYLMDKAVQYDPKGQLGYRGWCRYQFFRDYQGAINDIERIDSLVDYNIGYSVNGDYHLIIAKALCYKALGKLDKAISIIENKLADSSYEAGTYDYLHLGVAYLERKDFDKAIECFQHQDEIYQFAETKYYLAMAYKSKNDLANYIVNLSTAKNMYEKGKKCFDPYTERMDSVYLEEINKELDLAKQD